MKTDITLPNQIFFEPTQKFLDWIKLNAITKMVVDCGAGTGHLSAILSPHKIDVLSIDVVQRDNPESVVLKFDATEFVYPKNSIVIIARPNRGEWIHKTILQALKTCDYVLYIGLQEHVEEDITDLVLKNKIDILEIVHGVGENQETLYKLSKKAPKGIIMPIFRTFYLVKETLKGSNPECTPIINIMWYEKDGDKWISFSGGWHFGHKDDVILETKDVEDFHELDWRKTTLVEKDSESGWIDRDGNFTGCRSMNHDLIADLVFDKSVPELEKLGFVRVWGKFEDQISWVCLQRLSPYQRNTLSEMGHIVNDYD